MALHRFTALRRGVSLVEALVALAVMAFGMLALVGVQATMRLNSDVAKQRGEATRIATEEIERLRGFRTIAVVANEAAYASYDGMASGTPAYAAAGGIGNTTYTITRTVVTAAGLPHKSIAVRVSWTDRSNQEQSVTLETAISGTDPALAGLLSVLPTASATNQRSGRDASIPPVAVDVGNGSSAFKPFDTGTVAWVFNNLTGLITSRCTGIATSQASITLSDLTTCGAPINGRLLAGEVSFNFRFMPVDLRISGDDMAILKPAENASIAWVLDRARRSIVDTCNVNPNTRVALLTASDLDECANRDRVSPHPPRAVAPYQMQCDPAPCDGTDDLLVASDAAAPQWPALNLNVVPVANADASINTRQLNQTQAPECVDDAPNLARSALARTDRTVRYYCLVFTDNNGWGGRFNLQLQRFSDAGNVVLTTDTDVFKVCRYTTANVDYTANSDHPATYCMEKSGTATLEIPCTGKRVKTNLINQNFLVIAGSQNCPASTLPHQP